jgi:VanZ family protein
MKYLYTTVVSLLILVVVLLPGSAVPDVNFIGFDKIVHIGMFGLWALAVSYDFRQVKFLMAWAMGISFSLLTEVLQVFIEGRTFDWFDIFADIIGLSIGLLVGARLIVLLKIK